MDILLTIILDGFLFTLPLWLWIRKNKNQKDDLAAAIFVSLALGNLVFLLIGILMGLFGYAINIPVCIVCCIINTLILVDWEKKKKK